MYWYLETIRDSFAVVDFYTYRMVQPNSYIAAFDDPNDIFYLEMSDGYSIQRTPEMTTEETDHKVVITRKRGSRSYTISEVNPDQVKPPLWKMDTEKNLEHSNSLPAGFYKLNSNPSGIYFEHSDLTVDSLVALKGSNTETILKEIEDFKALKEAFQRYGFTHKRGYLLFGPPGSGKTSCLNLAMTRFISSGGICIISDSPSVLSDGLCILRQADRSVPIIVLLEDIDTMIKEYGESDVLALLDGQKAVNDIIYIATTNYPEELDGRIKDRPSRFDRVIQFDFPDALTRREFLIAKHACDSETELNEWVDKTAGFSISHLKEVIVAVKILGGGLDETIKRLNDMAKNIVGQNERNKTKTGFGR